MIKFKEAAFRISGLYKIYSRKLEQEIFSGPMPSHIALILDGNRRWAKINLRMLNAGHFKGADAVEKLLDWCEEFDIKIATFRPPPVEPAHAPIKLERSNKTGRKLGQF